MPSTERFRHFLNERLTTVADEIFKEFEKTIIEYEEVIKRQRRTLYAVLKPEVKIRTIEPQQQHVCQTEEEQEEVLSEQQPFNQEKNSNLDKQEEQQHPQTLKEPKKRKKHAPKTKPDSPTLTLTYEESNESEAQMLSCDETQRSVKKKPVKRSKVPKTKHDHQPLPHYSETADFQNNGDTESTQQADTAQGNGDSAMSDSPCNTSEKAFKCDTCGKSFKDKSNFMRHQRIHTGERPYSCDICGHKFNQTSALKVHQRIHTGEKPYTCSHCGKKFGNMTVLKVHERVHTGEKPYFCNICWSSFQDLSALNRHKKIHSGQKQHECDTCGNKFTDISSLKRHIRTHTGEKPYVCNTCGSAFRQVAHLNRHTKTHKEEESVSKT